MKPREAIDGAAAEYLALGIEAFHDGLVGLRSVLDIPEDLDVVEWIERHFYLSAETTGQTQLAKLFGYQRGMAREMCNPEVEEWYGPKSTRTGVTQIGAMVAAYQVRHKHTQCMMVQPTEQKAQEFANDYWTPAFRDSPMLAEIVRKPIKGERLDTWDTRLYSNGGMMRLGWAMSDGTFRGRTAQILMGDEVDDDGWMPSGEKSQGDKFKLFKDRGKTRHGSRLLLWSSPLRLRTSRIWPQWERSDKQYYFVPCPHEGCGHMQRLQWGSKDTRYGVKPHYDDEGRFVAAFYMCEACEQLIEDDRKTREWMDEHGEWRATAVAARKGIRGMHISALYSMAPNVSWSKLWEEWMDAQGDPAALQHFYNSNLGLPFDDVSAEKGADPGSFAEMRPEPYRAELPAWVRAVTYGADVQRGKDDPDAKDYLPPRVEVQVIGWGAQEESAVIGYFVIPATTPLDPACAAALDALKDRVWIREDGRKIKAVAGAMDCSWMMEEVIGFCQAAHRARFWTPVRGENEYGVRLAPFIISKPGVHAQTGSQFTKLGTRTGKNLVMRRLQNETPGPGHVHFPKSLQAAMPDGYDYFEGLFAERSYHDRKGVLVWERISKANTGEPWDTMLYALAALRIACGRNPALKAAMIDQRPRAEEVRWTGEDRSAMAQAALDKLVGKGTGAPIAAPLPRSAPKPVRRQPMAPVRSTFGGIRR
ncbi:MULTISPECIES: terminase gpA endonuclease subunit [unclassified Methylobacterium]|jgi:phage terminase large subunit GpA-like protein|uniref:terminase gpA endonuclease subunit n=1 Tax=unclassified Methylobacterium TaxID=2615210 RepID=UPI001354CE5F|nr:terminase gpA endonuclease subunit [Methylobacterium sp. 2A]MWV22447.1 hypothetical protein [Methylobacterium sp. 2A]